MDIYLSIPENQIDKAQVVLRQHGVLVNGIYFDPLEIFCENEASYRLNKYEEEYGKIENISLKNNIKSSLKYDFLGNNESFISGEALQEMTDHVIELYKRRGNL